MSNIMDDTPFLEINITSLSDADIEVLSLFKKEDFDAQKVVCVAEELIYAANLIEILEDVFREPNNENGYLFGNNTAKINNLGPGEVWEFKQVIPDETITNYTIANIMIPGCVDV